jgi:hypothetical protein
MWGAAMDNLLRFSDYDVFAYLASGFGALGLWDTLFGTHLVIGASWTVATGTISVVGAYITGHILAAPASSVMEHGLVKSWLGTPSVRLMASAPPRRGILGFLAASFCREYFRPLEAGLVSRVRTNATGIEGEGLFWHAYGLARADQAASARLEGFLRLYGFCRNIAFVGLLGTFALAAKAVVFVIQKQPAAEIRELVLLSIGAMIIFLGMTHRYLKFHRLYTVEAFVVLARQKSAGTNP